MQLTERNIRSAQPGDRLKDVEVRGLEMRVSAKAKSFLLYYRTRDGQQRRPKVGEWGQITLTQARKVARDMLTKVAAGQDPSGDRAALRAEPLVADLWEEFWKRHASRIKTGTTYQRQWRLHVEPRFGRMRVKDVGYRDIADLHESMASTPTEANRVLAMLSGMFAFARRPLEWTTANPVEGVRRNRETKRHRYMRGEEAARIAEILHREADENPASVAFLYLLILTGARKGEIANAKWSDLEGNRLVLHDHKTAERTGEPRFIYLPHPAMDVLERLPRTSGTITGIQTPQKLWERVREEAGCPDLRMHDLRHSFASSALAAGLSLAQIGELLGHKSTQTTKRYTHLIEEAAVAAATATADHIVAAMKKAPA